MHVALVFPEECFEGVDITADEPVQQFHPCTYYARHGAGGCNDHRTLTVSRHGMSPQGTADQTFVFERQ
jgi:hypothetical protein